MSTTKPDRDAISHYECMHASYSKALDGKSDVVVVKELIHYKDGRPPEPNLRLIKDYQREFAVTLEPHRTHKDKKTFEKLSKVRKFPCYQYDLQDKVAKALGKPGSQFGLRQLARSPYLYGADIETPVLVKRSYKDRFKFTPTPAKVAVYDLEWAIDDESEGEIVLGTMSFKEKVFTCVLDTYAKREENFVEKLHARAQELLAESFEKRKVKLEVLVVNSPAQIVVECFKRAHEWQPDYVAMFNIDADIPKSLAALADEGIDPRTVFCDPRVPWKYRRFEYIKGKAEKKSKKDDKPKPINPIDQWHYTHNTASFILCCAMLLYKRIRTAAPNEPSYNLDAILQRNGIPGKLKHTVPGAEGLIKGEWHIYMQHHAPVDYAVYNIADCIRVEELDEKTKDIAMSLGALLKSSQYKTFNSQPQMIADDLHFFGLKKGLIIASTSDQMLNDIDELSPGLKGWIVTLPAYMVRDNEDDVVIDLPGNKSLIFTNVSDIDIVSTYPTLQQKLNVDRETTMTELSSVEGLEEEEWREIGIDLTAARVNAAMLGARLFKLPTMDEMLAEMSEGALAHLPDVRAANEEPAVEEQQAA